MIFVYPNTISTFHGDRDAALKAGYIEVEEQVYQELVETKKKWKNEKIVDDPTYETRHAQEVAERNRIQEINQCKARLRELDYIGVKIATGRATIEEYSTEIAEMTRLAGRINELEEQSN